MNSTTSLDYTDYTAVEGISQEVEKPDVYSNDLKNVFIKKYVGLKKDVLDWKLLSKNPTINKKFIDEFADKIDWNSLSETDYVTTDEYSIIVNNKERFDWSYLCSHVKLTPLFFELFGEDLVWDSITLNKTCDEDLIEVYAEKINWPLLNQRLDDFDVSFIEKHVEQIELTDDNIEKMFKRVAFKNFIPSGVSAREPYGYDLRGSIKVPEKPSTDVNSPEYQFGAETRDHSNDSKQHSLELKFKNEYEKLTKLTKDSPTFIATSLLPKPVEPSTTYFYSNPQGPSQGPLQASSQDPSQASSQGPSQNQWQTQPQGPSYIYVPTPAQNINKISSQLPPELQNVLNGYVHL
jgi:hypothetical protein